MSRYVQILIAALAGFATPTMAQDLDMSAYENLDLSQFENMNPADLGIDMEGLGLEGMGAINNPLADPTSGPAIPCTKDQDPKETGCVPRTTYIFYQSFNSRLREWVRGGRHNISTYQFTRDCTLASSATSFDPLVDNGSDEVLFDLRGIHNMNFWTGALKNLNHGHSEADMLRELESGDTPITKIFLNDDGSGNDFLVRNDYLQGFYNDCDRARSELGGFQEKDAPTGTIPASQYMSSQR